MPEIKAPKIDINTDILRIGGHLYAVKRIQAKDIDINKELKELYGKRFDAHVSQLNEGCVTDVVKDWNTQIQHLRKYEGKNAKAIPERMFDKPVVYYRNMLLELRAVIYAPAEFVGTAQDTRFTAIRQKLIEALGETEAYGVTTIVVTIKPPFAVPVLYGYDERTKMLYSPFSRTFHSFEDGRICTGNHTAEDFWRLDGQAFPIEMCKVNLFSPACRRMTVNGREHTLESIITLDNFVSARRRGADTWNASR